MFVSNASTPTRMPTIYDLYKKPVSSNIPDDLIGGSRWIIPIVAKPYNFKTKSPKIDTIEKAVDTYPIFSDAAKETMADRYAKAHFRELDRRAYEDFLTSSRTYWLTNAPEPPKQQQEVITVITNRKRRGRKPKPVAPDSAIGSSIRQ